MKDDNKARMDTRNQLHVNDVQAKSLRDSLVDNILQLLVKDWMHQNTIRIEK